MDSARWDQRYGASELVWSAEPNLFLPPLARSLPPGSALDIACGEGRNAIWLARQGWAVTAVDFSAVAIDKGKALASDVDVKWVVADVTTYEPDGLFDLVMIFYLHLPRDPLAAAFKRAVSALAPGGTLFGVVHALRNLTDGYGGPPNPKVLWSKDRIAPMLSGLHVVELGERNRYVESANATAIDLVVHATNNKPFPR